MLNTIHLVLSPLAHNEEMRLVPSRGLRFFLAADPALLRAWEMGRCVHEDHHEPQMSLDLAEHYLENADDPKPAILTFFLAMSALQCMGSMEAQTTFGPEVAALAQEIATVDMNTYEHNAAASVPLSALARETMNWIIDYMNQNMAQARADALIAQSTEESVRKMHYALILQLAELEEGRKPN